MPRHRLVIDSPVVLAYAAWMASTDFSSHTVQDRTRWAHRLACALDPLTATPMELATFLGSSKAKSAWSRRTYYNHARAFFDWLVAAELRSDNPLDSPLLRKPRQGQGVPKPLTLEEEKRALEAASGDMYAYLILALRAGLRAHEIAKVAGEDVREDFLTVRGKGLKEAVIPTHAQVWALTQDYPERGYWFPHPGAPGTPLSASVLSRRVGDHFRKPEVDIPTGSIHRCRHTYATTLLRRGANIREVQTLMRHSSLATTAIYTAVDDESLRSAIDLL